MFEPKFLTSSPRHLMVIKKRQYIRQLAPIAVIGFGIGMQYWFPSASYLNYPALVVTLLGIAWYMWILGSHRYQNKIPVPHESAILTPIDGNIQYIRTNQDLCLINITRTFLDPVEIRCPHKDCVLEDEMLKLHLEDGTITFRFNSDKIKWFETRDFESGAMIGMISGKASCTITIPAVYETELKEKNAVHAGITVVSTTTHLSRPERDIIAKPDGLY